MSEIAAWSYTVIATIWRPGAKDSNGRFSWSQPQYIYCAYRIGGADEYVDSTGQKFVPKSTYWTEMKMIDSSFADDPVNGCKIQLGQQVGNPTSSAEDMRVVTKDGMEMFGQKPDFTVMT